MILSDAIDRVELYIDDTSNDRWTTAEISQKLEVALDSVVNQYVARGGTRLDDVLELTTDSTGYLTLSGYNPIAISSVQLNNGGTYFAIPEVTASQVVQPSNTTHNLRVRMVKTPTFPATNSDSFVYHNNMSSKLMDELVVLKAARLCLTKDKELDQSLELQFQETLATLLSSELSTQVYDFQSVFPYNRNPYCYEKFNNDLYVRLRIS
jgi:hypothetical protein